MMHGGHRLALVRLVPCSKRHVHPNLPFFFFLAFFFYISVLLFLPKHGQNPEDMIEDMRSLGMVYCRQGNYERAEVMYRR